MKGWNFLKECTLFNYFIVTFPYSLSLTEMVMHFARFQGFELEEASVEVVVP
jgi:hypothetical protein